MDIFATAVLAGVVRSLQVAPMFLLDTYFPNVQEETSEEIHFDFENGKRRIAPFVSPLVEGKVVESLGFTTKSFKPAYIKDKRVFDASRPLRRAMGEQIGGNLTPEARIRLMMAQDLLDQQTMINRRMEVMASEALRLGQVTVSGENYPTVVVSYGRDGSLQTTLTTPNRWGESGIKPLGNLQTWGQTVLQKSGTMPRDVTMDLKAWDLFVSDTEVKEELDRFRGSSTLVTNSQMEEGGVFMGQVRGWNIYVYSGWYVDENGTEQKILPDYTVLMGSKLVQGYRAFGAIRDEKAGYQAMPYFAKSWVTEDPAVRFLMMQSAPLVVPYRPNATFRATVYS